MILSERHRFVFIKGRKVAGTSTEMALAALCGPDDIITPISPIDERARLPNGARNYSGDRSLESAYLSAVRALAPSSGLKQVQAPKGLYFNHMSLADVARRYGDLAGFEIIFVERNPYAKVISWANLQGAYGAYNRGSARRSSPARVRRKIDEGQESGAILKVRNIDRYRCGAEALPVGWRYESLPAQLAAWAADKGPVTLPHAKEGLLSNQLDVRTWLTAHQIDRVTELFWEEFTSFGYEPLACRGCAPPPRRP